MTVTPIEYEKLVADLFKSKGYKVEQTSANNDYGVDVFAENEREKIAIQVKMYGKTARKINRQMIMELFGAKSYFSCSRAVIVTNGKFTDNALEVANRLNIDIVFLDSGNHDITANDTALNFEFIWKTYIMPLCGKILKRENGKSNKILSVDWSGIKRVTSNNKEQFIKIEIFKWAIEYILKNGFIERKKINEEYVGRASSGIVLILSNVPIFEIVKTPTLGLRMKKHDNGNNL